jgi:uncharacterized GH25 family protein
MKRGLHTIVILVLSLVLQAHEFWMAPSKFYYQVGEIFTMGLRVGEDFIGEVSPVKKERIEKLELHQSQKVQDVRSFIKDDGKELIALPVNVEGSNVIAIQTTSAYIELDAEKFNAYLKEDALDDAHSYRRKNNQLDKPGKEFYARYSKMIFQVGDKIDDGYKKPVGLPLEIFVEQNPATLKVGSKVSFKLMWDGKPLFGARVSVWNRHNNRTTRQPIFTQQDGRIETHISNPGPWMVSVVKMVRSNDPKADWQSYWGSLTFGVKQ